MESHLTPLQPDQKFCFNCSPQVKCFNNCCQDLNQVLMPYDILRLKNHLKLTSSGFLEKYTITCIGSETGLPIISLKPAPGKEKLCPFVAPRGCLVYPARPSSCRAYPLARALSRSRESGLLTEHFALIKESHCKGFSKGQTWTVKHWIKSQDLELDFKINDLLMEIISLKNQFIAGELGTKEEYLFRLALYDIDQFRYHIQKKGVSVDSKIKAQKLHPIKTDDIDDIQLLIFAHQWVKKELFKH